MRRPALSVLLFLVPLLSLTACTLPPSPFLVDPDPAASSSVTQYIALGDSITFGALLTSHTIQAYPARIATARGWNLSNVANVGDMACDLFPAQILPNRIAFTPEIGRAYSLLIGTNDADLRGTGNYETLFQNCQLAAIAWVATRHEDKIHPGDSSVETSGSCTNSDGDTAFNCAGAGTLSIPSLHTTGNPLYVWYTISDSAASTDAFTLNVDGTMTRISVRPPGQNTIHTQNGSTSTINILRIASLPAGDHAIRISTASGNTSILSVGTNRAIKPIVVAVGDVPNQRLSNPVASVATQLAYTQLVRQNIATAVSDALDVHPVNDRDYMMGTADEMTDQLHPNALGHVHLAMAFSSQLP